MKRSLSVVAAGIIVGTSGVASAAAHASAITSLQQSVGAATCTAGTWMQLPANVTSAMVNGRLIDATIVSSTDAWAVGTHYTNGSGFGSLWEHWTGGSGMRIVTSGGNNVVLRGVTNFGADDVWAVGFVQKAATTRAVISRWNGSTIVRSTVPTKGVQSYLIAISGSSASDIWAMGEFSTRGGADHVLLVHYNGTSWALMTAPTGAVLGDGILDLSPSNVYLLAEGTTNSDLYHFNGHTWSVSQADVPVGGPFADGLSGSSGTDLYAVDATGGSVVDHWNGSAWSHVGTPNGQTLNNGVAEGPVGTIWSAGDVTSTGSTQVYVAANGFRQMHPSGIMTQDGSMDAIASGFGVVIAVGAQYGAASPSEPIVLMSCS
jgi:hypothetical protein